MSTIAERFRRAVALIKQQQAQLEQQKETTAAQLVGQLMASEDIVKAIVANRLSADDVVAAVQQINLPAPHVQVTVPDVHVPEITVPPIVVPDIVIPEIKIPKIPAPIIPPIKVPKPAVTVNVKVPPIKVPLIKLPTITVPPADVQVTFPETMDVRAVKPLPVTLYDTDGKPSLPGTGGARVTSVDLKRSTKGRYGAVAVATTATQVMAEVPGRRAITITHESDDPVYLGFDEYVTTGTGFPVVANQIYGFGDYVGQVYAIISPGAGSSTISLRYQEV